MKINLVFLYLLSIRTVTRCSVPPEWVQRGDGEGGDAAGGFSEGTWQPEGTGWLQGGGKSSDF